MPSGINSGLDLARFEKQRAKYARRRMRALRLRSPWLPEDIQERATLRRISYGVKRAGEGQTRLTQTEPGASSGAPRRSADETSALIQTKLSSTPESKVFTVSEDSGSESDPTSHE